MIRLDRVHREYGGDSPVAALHETSLTIEPGEFVAITGPSGSGKSTLLNLIGLLDKPSGGSITIDGVDAVAAPERAITLLRAHTFAFIFQAFHLLERRPVLDSVELGLAYRGVDRPTRRARAAAALHQVGLLGAAWQDASTLSGGQRQRVAIARAMAAGAPTIVADEPTGNLDSRNATQIVDLLVEANERGATVVLVTHSAEIAQVATRRIALRDGRITSDERLRPSPVAPREAAADEAATEWTASEGSAADGAAADGAAADGAAADGAAADGAAAEGAETDARAAGGAAAEGAGQGRARATLRPLDLLRDAASSLLARRARTAGLAVAVAVAIGLAISTFGLTATAAAQVSDTFDRHANRDVTGQWPGGNEPIDEKTRAELLAGLAALNGVGHAALLDDLGRRSIHIDSARDGLDTGSFAATGAIVQAARLTVETAPGVETAGEIARGGGSPGEDAGDEGARLRSGEILLGATLAKQLQLAPIDLRPQVLVEGEPRTVAGLITRSPRMPQLLGSLVMPVGDALGAGSAQRYAMIVTGPGAAQLIAEQLPLAIDPAQPAKIRIDQPKDPTTLRSEVEADVRASLIGVTAVALIAAIAALGNSMMSSVMERRQEIGLRRAVGARRRHITTLILVESALIGAIGGVVGFAAGTGCVLGVTIARHWIPTLDLALAPAAVLGGIAVGALGGVFSAARASRLVPSSALRA